jgi:hypothetical protein
MRLMSGSVVPPSKLIAAAVALGFVLILEVAFEDGAGEIFQSAAPAPMARQPLVSFM